MPCRSIPILMMKIPTPRLTALLLAASTLTVSAASWWEEMDYGRFLSASFIDNVPFKGTDHNGKEKQFDGRTPLDGATRIAANKGIAVKLGAEGQAGFLFDTELLRATGAWTGGWLKLKGVVFDGAHGPVAFAAFLDLFNAHNRRTYAANFTDPCVIRQRLQRQHPNLRAVPDQFAGAQHADIRVAATAGTQQGRADRQRQQVAFLQKVSVRHSTHPRP